MGHAGVWCSVGSVEGLGLLIGVDGPLEAVLGGALIGGHA